MAGAEAYREMEELNYVSSESINSIFHKGNAELCNGKADGNYAIKDALNHFVQCVDKRAYCQSCWPQSLVFKEECNQCLYHMKGKHVIISIFTNSNCYYTEIPD